MVHKVNLTTWEAEEKGALVQPQQYRDPLKSNQLTSQIHKNLLLRKDEYELDFHAHPLYKMFCQQIYKQKKQMRKIKIAKQ